jgi:hypothetical protein
MSKHTPGPWKQRGLVVMEDSPRQMFVADVFVNTPGDEAEANARLIAAAPDLLAACLQALCWFDSDEEPSYEHDQMVGEQLRLAARKAQGDAE